MASLGCGINSILERIDNIRTVLKKYSIVTNGIGNYPAIASVVLTVSIPFNEFFANIGTELQATSLYQKIQEAYSIAKTGYEYIKAVQEAVTEITNDFGTVVSNLSGILQDLQDLTVLDIQVLELDLAKLGFNPGEVITRLKNGENIDQVLGDAKERLSASSSALIDKISKPLTISFDTTCQKLPNVVLMNIGNIKTPVILPVPPQKNSPGLAEKQDRVEITIVKLNDVVGTPLPPSITTGGATPPPPVVTTFKGVKDAKYNFTYFADTGFSSGYKISRDWNKISAELSKKLGIDSVTLRQYVETNLNLMGVYLIRPLVDKYPDIVFTSGWRATIGVARQQNRNPNAVSWHAYGCAIDFKSPRKYYVSDKDNPMQFLLQHIKTLRVGPGNSKIGYFQLIKEMDPGDKYEDIVWHVGARFVPIGTNSYNGDTLKLARTGRTKNIGYTLESSR